MKLTLLGVYGPYPSKGNGACSCYLVESKGTKLLLDLGCGSLSKAFALDGFEEIENVFLSHFHYDHTSDMLPLHYYAENNGKHYNIICPRPQNEYANILLDCRCFTPTFINEGEEIVVGNLTLSFFKVKHSVPTYGVRISDGEKILAYSGDGVLDDNVIELCQGADIILIDATRKSGFKGPHMTVEDAKKLKTLNNAITVATHIDPDNDPTRELESHGIIVASSGLTVEC